MRYPRTLFLALFIVLAVVALILWNYDREERVRVQRAIQACGSGWSACRTSQGYALQDCISLPDGSRVNRSGGVDTPCTEPDPAEDESVCGDGWRACRNTAAEGAE